MENFEGDGLPNIEKESDILPFQDDTNIFDDAVMVTMSGDEDESNLEKDDTPLYPNQEQDPEVWNLMWDEQHSP